MRDIPERFFELHKDGRSASEIAAILGVSPRTIQRYRAATQLAAKPHAPRPASDRERVKALLDDGCSFAEAARTVGVEPTTAKRWFPDIPRWTKSQAGTYARLQERFRAA